MAACTTCGGSGRIGKQDGWTDPCPTCRPAGYVTTTPEKRQIARVLSFDSAQADFIDWNKIGQLARELAAHFESRTDRDGITITMFWSYADGEV